MLMVGDAVYRLCYSFLKCNVKMDAMNEPLLMVSGSFYFGSQFRLFPLLKNPRIKQCFRICLRWVTGA